MTLSICEVCGRVLDGPVAAVMHYERTNDGPSPCDRYRARRQRA